MTKNPPVHLERISSLLNQNKELGQDNTLCTYLSERRAGNWGDPWCTPLENSNVSISNTAGSRGILLQQVTGLLKLASSAGSTSKQVFGQKDLKGYSILNTWNWRVSSHHPPEGRTSRPLGSGCGRLGKGRSLWSWQVEQFHCPHNCPFIPFPYCSHLGLRLF